MPGHKDDEAEIRRLLEARIAAIRTKDAEGATADYTSDVLTFDLPPPLRSEPGAARDKAGIQQWFDTWDGPIEFQVRDLAITAGEDVAFTTALNRIGGNKVDYGHSSVWTRATICLRKEEGRWLVAHEHFSVPFRMDGSEKAELHLEP